MCRAGFEVLDVYPLSASFPNGTDSSQQRALEDFSAQERYTRHKAEENETWRRLKKQQHRVFYCTYILLRLESLAGVLNL